MMDEHGTVWIGNENSNQTNAQMDGVGLTISQVAANHVCAQKMIEMMEDEGLDTLDDLADEIIDRTEISMRGAIEKIPDGTYSHEGIIEGSASKPDIPIKLTVKVDGTTIHVDFDGTSKQVPWGVNVVYNFTYAYVFMAIKSGFDPEIPINEGAIRPITMSAPEGTIVNCKFPAAVAARMVVGHFMTEMVFNALAKASPDNIIAGSGGTPAQTNIFHGSFADGRPWHTMIIRGGGMGASSKFDGHHCAIFPANGANTPVEILESDTTMLVESRGLVTDSGGPGKQRGGIGRKMIIRSLEDGVRTTPATRRIPRRPVPGNKAERIANQPMALVAFGDPSGLAASLVRFGFEHRSVPLTRPS